MTTKRLSISEFKAHCTEEIRALEKGGAILELTRHGKPVAVVQSVASAQAPASLAEWMGSGRGTFTYGPGYDASTPAWAPEDWES